MSVESRIRSEFGEAREIDEVLVFCEEVVLRSDGIALLHEVTAIPCSFCCLLRELLNIELHVHGVFAGTCISVERNILIRHDIYVYHYLIVCVAVLRIPSPACLSTIVCDREVAADVLSITCCDCLVYSAVSVLSEGQCMLVAVKVYIDYCVALCCNCRLWIESVCIRLSCAEVETFKAYVCVIVVACVNTSCSVVTGSSCSDLVCVVSNCCIVNGDGPFIVILCQVLNVLLPDYYAVAC